MANLYTDIADGDLATPALWNDRFNALRKGDAHNLKAYNAAGDGTTDDTTAIEAAVAAAYTSGGIVYAPPGNYLHGAIATSSTLSPVKTVRIVGAGQGATTFKANANSITMFDLSVYASLEHCTVDGNGKSSIKGVRQRSKASCRGVRVINCASGFYREGSTAGAYGVNYASTYDCIADTCGTGFHNETIDGATPWVNNNWDFGARATACTSYGVKHSGASSNVFVGNIESNTGMGHWIENGTGNHVVAHYESNTLGHLYHSRDAATTGTFIHGNGLASWAGTVNTMGDISVGTATLTVAAATNIVAGKVIAVAGAGAAAATLYSRVVSVSGTTVILADNAGTTVVAASVTGPSFLNTQSVSVVTEANAYEFGHLFVDKISMGANEPSSYFYQELYGGAQFHPIGGASGAVLLDLTSDANYFDLRDSGGNVLLQVNKTLADTETSLLVYRNAAGVYATKRVKMDADSGGKRFLYVDTA